MLLVPRQLRRAGMTGDVPYYGGRMSPAQAYAAAHPRPVAAPVAAPQVPAPTVPAPTPQPDSMTALADLLETGVITPEEYDALRARVTS